MSLENLLNLPVYKILRIIATVFLSYSRPYQFENNSPVLPTYDFIVVGAGAAGCVVAAELAKTSASVLVLEEGPSATPESSIVAFSIFLSNSGIIKATKLVPQNNTHYELENNTDTLLEGRVMGGGSSVNGLQFYKGSREDFDNWSALGNEGWNYDSVLPFYKELEDFQGPVLPGNENFHGKGGPIPVTSRVYNSDFLSIFEETGRELGFKRLDLSSPNKIGFGNVLINGKDGIRVSASEAFLKPVAEQKNIVIKPRASVRKIVFNDSKRAVGVEFLLNGKKHRVGVSKEVILSAGGINSPKLLMLSGIGPRNHLQSLGIKAVADVQGVGENLQNHLYVDVQFSSPTKISTPSEPILQSIISKFTSFKTSIKGYLTESSTSAAAFINVNDEDNKLWPDVMLALIGTPGVLTTHVLLCRPKSRGSVRLRSNNYEDDPLIDFRFLHDSLDVKTYVEALKFTKRMSETNVMQRRLKLKFQSKTPKRCRSFRQFSDSYWECFARSKLRTYYHPSGSCKMAPDSDPLGVVTPRLRLRGVEGVRVADASIMPQIVTSNILNTVIMIGKKAADIIKQDWRL